MNQKNGSLQTLSEQEPRQNFRIYLLNHHPSFQLTRFEKESHHLYLQLVSLAFPALGIQMSWLLVPTGTLQLSNASLLQTLKASARL